MKLLFLTNNEVSAPLLAWLNGQAELVAWDQKLTVENIGQFAPDLIVSYSYRHILSKEVLAALPNRFVNLHISYLPYNRGADPNVWSFLENTPRGVSIHLIDEGIDTGSILLQKEVIFDENAETLGHSYQILQEEIQALFIKNWDGISNGRIRPQPQKGKGTFHKASEFKAIKDRLLGEEGWDVPIALLKQRYQRS